MRRFRLALQVTGAVLCLTSVLLDAPADAAPTAYESAVMTPLYAPGNASALRPSYDGNYIVFACQYNAWVSTPIYWSCELWTTTGYKVDSRSNSSNRQTFYAGNFYHPAQVGTAYCTRAFAYNADGGDSDEKCQ